MRARHVRGNGASRAVSPVAPVYASRPEMGARTEPHGTQRPMLNVFHRDRDAIRHFWGSELFYAPTEPAEDPRHVGTLEPLWNLLDLTPEGRPADWYEQLSYSA